MTSSKAGFFLVGSWDDWKGFTPLKPSQKGEVVCQARIEVRQPPGLEEFQILQDRKWELRFYPSSDGRSVMGPENAHGKNFRVPIPTRCWFLELSWDPRGARRLDWRFLGRSGQELQKRNGDNVEASANTSVQAAGKAWFLQGSWDGFKDFVQLTPGTRDTEFSARLPVQAKSVAEFVVVKGRDPQQKYYPKDGVICGPVSDTPAKWRIYVPAKQSWLDVTWDPLGDRHLKTALLGAAERHLQAAEEFASLFLDMRSESPAGAGWLKGMWRIFNALPTCYEHSPYAKKAEPDATATCLLATLVRDAETMRDARGPAQDFQRAAFIELEAEAEKHLHAVSGALNFPPQPNGNNGDWMQASIPHDDTVDGTAGLTLFQRLVYLPLLMYVRNTVHLYELLDRLKSQAKTVTRGGRLRRLLDRKGTRSESPYSWLIYGIVGALQTLRHVRRQVGDDRFPSELLASSPPHTVWFKGGSAWKPGAAVQPGRFTRDPTVRNCQPMKPLGSFKKGYGLMFRGIWLPGDADEGMLRYQYSFQSFSRCIEGVMRVMRFYSDVAETKAHEAALKGQILLYVARSWPSNPLVTPVQFFDGPKKRAEDSEEELLLPPFMVYDFEDDCSIDPDMEVVERQEHVEELESRWDVVLPENLKNFFFGLIPHMNHTRTQSLDGSIALSVRFISSMALAPPVARLFEDDSCHLYAWPASAPQAGMKVANSDSPKILPN